MPRHQGRYIGISFLADFSETQYIKKFLFICVLGCGKPGIIWSQKISNPVIWRQRDYNGKVCLFVVP